MTDKQIIIDGVDVSKCEYLQYKGCNFPQCLVKIASFDLKCEGYNCHLKRLVQKEQECETLKDENFAFEELIKTQEELIDKYKQALDKNQELQDKLLKLNDLAHEVLLYELQTLDIDFDEYEAHVRDTEFSPIVTRCTEMIDLIGYKDKYEV